MGGREVKSPSTGLKLPFLPVHLIGISGLGWVTASQEPGFLKAQSSHLLSAFSNQLCSVSLGIINSGGLTSEMSTAGEKDPEQLRDSELGR